MKNRLYPMMLAFAMCCTSCEKVLDYEGTLEDISIGSMVINAVAIVDSPFSVYINRAERADQAHVRQFVNFDTAMYNNDPFYRSYQSNDYLDNTLIDSAQVEVQVNGHSTYPMVFSAKNRCYQSSYIPHEGDHLLVKASADGETLTAETTVPAKPKIEIVSHEELDENPYRYQNGLTFETDSIMHLTLRIKDMGDNNYYRLRVRGIGMGYGTGGGPDPAGSGKTIWQSHPYYNVQDIFFSDDDLFVDSRLTTNFGGWPAFFSNVFNTQLLHGSDYVLNVDSPKVPYESPFWEWMKENGIVDDSHLNDIPFLPTQVMVELQAITEDYYRFLKSVELYRITDTGANSETIHIHGNAVNGWGILGAMSYDRHVIYYGN
ncbi:MAG: DUF4249 family protein [Bacteroidales bacterium]